VGVWGNRITFEKILKTTEKSFSWWSFRLRAPRWWMLSLPSITVQDICHGAGKSHLCDISDSVGGSASYGPPIEDG